MSITVLQQTPRLTTSSVHCVSTELLVLFTLISNMRSMLIVLLGVAALAVVVSAQNKPMLTGEINHTRFPGGHKESFKLSQDAWVSKNGNWRAGGYVQHDRERFNGMRQSNTHGGISITGRFRRMAEAEEQARNP